MIFCCDINGIMTLFGVNYDPIEWRLFVDSSKHSMNGVLLHNRIFFGFIPIVHSVYLKMFYKNSI